MRIFLAARYSRRDELREFAGRIEAQGHTVRTRWLRIDIGRVGPDGGSELAAPEERERAAGMDLEDVDAADCVISFTEPERINPGRGGRHVEFGYALGKLKRCVVIGHRENVFHHFPEVEFYPDAETALDKIGYESP